MPRASTERPGGPLLGHESGDADFARLVADVAARLRPVCAGWDAADFHALVCRIAQREVRWGDAYRTEPYRTDAHRID